MGSLWRSLAPNLLMSLGGDIAELCLWDQPIKTVCKVQGRWVLHLEALGRGMLAAPKQLELTLSDGQRVSLLSSMEGLEWEGVQKSTPYTSLSKGLEVSLWDSNPLSMLEAHPDKDGNALDLGGRPLAEWTTQLESALELITTCLPTWAEERVDTLQRIVPVGYDPERHLSASYREAPGIAWMSLHPNRLIMAEALIHETQHGKLNTLSWLDPILKNGHSEWTSSPVRPDLRPLMGVLLAVHAFVPVAVLHHQLRVLGHPIAETPTFERRRSQVLESNAQGLKTLKEKGEWSPIGSRVFQDLERLQMAVGDQNT